MEHLALRPHPHLNVSLIVPQDELDLSGQHPFHLQLLVVLHAKGPVLLYTADTFLSPQVALRQGGLGFSRKSSSGSLDPLPRSTVDVNRSHGTSRPANPSNFLVLEPEKPEIIDVPFGRHAATSTTFDVRFWITTSAFTPGETYEASTPTSCKVTWWRWANSQESEAGVDSSLLSRHGPYGVMDFMRSWWSGKEEAEGVPVLPDDEQLSIVPSGGVVTFSCVGKRVEPPGFITTSE